MQKQPSRKKAVMIQVIGGYLNTSVSITQGLLLLPIYFKFIDYTTYGYWVTIGSIIALLSILNFGIGNMVTQRISSNYAKHNYQAVVDYFINSQLIFLLISILLFLVGYGLSFWLNNILSSESTQFKFLKDAYLIALITSSLVVLSNSIKGFSQALLKPLFGVYSTLVSRIVGIIVTVTMLYQNVGLLSIPIGLLITEILIFTSNSMYCYSQYKRFKIKSKVQKKIIMEYLNLSPHLFGLMIGDILTNKSHPLIITSFLGAEITTAYAVTRKAIEIIDQTINTFNSSLIGPFSHLVGEGDIQKTKEMSIKIISLSFFAVVIAFGTYMVTNHMFVSLWVSEKIVLPQKIIEIMGFAAISYSMTRLFRSQLFGLSQFKYTSNLILIEGILFIILAIFLISKIGLLGVPLSLLVVSSTIAFFLGLKIKTILKIKYNKQNLYKQFIIVIFIIFYLDIVEKTAQNSWLYFVSFSVVSIVLFSTIIYIINYKYFKNIKIKGK